MKNKICMLYTGGTIGMVKDAGGTLRPPENPEDFLNVAPELKNIVDLDFVNLINKDSTNIVPQDWTIMAKAIYDRQDDGYSGFVVAHGTDTMHFSASAVAFALGENLNFPVVFTGAQTIPDVEHGDARLNLVRAVMVAQENLAEVVISFGDYVFRGCRTQKKDEKRFDAFESPALYPIADIMENIIIHPVAKKQAENIRSIELIPNFSDGVLQVGLIPGLKPSLIEPVLNSGKCKGIVLQSFGAGNVPDWKNYGFSSFIKSAKEKNIPIIITSQFPANSTMDTHYEPGLAAINAGAIPTGNMTSAAATVKFRWVLSKVTNDIQNGTYSEQDKLSLIKEKMNKTYVLEMD